MFLVVMVMMVVMGIGRKGYATIFFVAMLVGALQFQGDVSDAMLL